MEELLHDKLQERDALNKQEGIKEGIKEGRVKLLAELVSEGVMTISDAARKMGLTEAAFKKIAVL